MATVDALVDQKSHITSTENDKGNGKEGSNNNKWKNKKKGNNELSISTGSHTKHNKPTASKSKGCSICDGPHMAKNSPKKENVNTTVMEEGSRPANRLTHVNPLQLLNVIQREVQPTIVNRLIYVQIMLNNVIVHAMVDTGAMHNLASNREVHKLGTF